MSLSSLDSGFRAGERGESLLARLARWVRLPLHWWQADRVRASPREGKLLRLSVPCIVRIENQWLRVLRRRVCQCATGPFVIYDCETDHGPGELRATPPAGDAATLEWRDRDGRRAIDERDVEVFG